ASAARHLTPAGSSLNRAAGQLRMRSVPQITMYAPEGGVTVAAVCRSWLTVQSLDRLIALSVSRGWTRGNANGTSSKANLTVTNASTRDHRDRGGRLHCGLVQDRLAVRLRHQTVRAEPDRMRSSAAGRLLERTRVRGFGADGELVDLAADR